MRAQQPDPDAELVAAWQAGKDVTREALEDLMNRIAGWICRRNDRLRPHLDDLVAETVRRVYWKIGTFRGDALFFTWVISFAKNILLEHYRKLKEEASVPLDEITESSYTEDPETVALLRLAAAEAVQALTEQERQVWALRTYEDLSFNDIATQLQITPNAAQKTAARAAQKIERYRKEHGWL